MKKIFKNLEEALKMLENYTVEEKEIIIKKISLKEIKDSKFRKLIFLIDYLEKELYLPKKRIMIETLKDFKFVEYNEQYNKRNVNKLKRIYFPECINHSRDSFNFLLGLTKEIVKDSETLILDLKKTTFFSSDQCSILGAIILPTLDRKKYFVGIENYSGRIKRIFKNNHFSETFGIEKTLQKKDDTIIYKEISSDDIAEFEDYIKDCVIKKIQESMGELVNETFLNELRKVFRELFINVQEHTTSKQVYLSGQFLKSKNTLFFSFVNLGETIIEKINENKPEIAKESRIRGKQKKLIEWALGKGNTTKQKSETGGLGLAKLSQFIEKATGSFTIVSDKELYKKTYEDNKNENRTSFLKNPLKGTAVILKINFINANYYKNFTENEIFEEYTDELF